MRGIHFAATVLASGTVCFMALVLEPAARAVGKSGKSTAAGSYAELRRRLAALIWASLALALLSGLAWLALVSADILGASLADVFFHGGLWEIASGTRFGAVMALRLAVAGLMGIMLMVWPAARLLPLAAAAWIGLTALTGHAGATIGILGPVHLASDIAHLLAAGAWLGGLPAFALTLFWARSGTGPARSKLTVATTARFSTLGIVSVGVLAASDLINS